MKRERRFLGFFLAFVMLMSVAGIQIPVFADTQIVGEEMVLDGGFEAAEAGSALSGGNAGQFNPRNAEATVYEADGDGKYVRTGNHSAKIVQNGSTTNEGALNYFIDVEAGKTYKISAYVRYDESFKSLSANGSNIYIRFAESKNDSAYYGLKGMTTAQKDGSSDFMLIESTVTMQENDTGKVRINISSNAKAGETFYIDDVSCVEVKTPEVTPEPSTEPTPGEDGELIADGGFDNYEAGYEFPASGNIRVNNGKGVIVNKDGNKYVQITGDAGKQGAMNYILSLEAGVTYYFSADVCYAEGYNGGVYARITDVLTGEKDSNGKDIADFLWDDRAKAEGLKGGADFVTLGTYYTPSKNYPNARLNIVIERNGGIAYVDNVSCKIVTPVDPMVREGNLIGENASFEFADRALPSIGNGTGEITDKYAHRGNYSLQINSTSTTNELGVNFTGNTLKAGKTYRFGAWARMDEETAVKNPRFYVRMMNDSVSPAAQLVRTESSSLTKDSGFTFVSAIYTAAQDISNVRLNIGLTADGSAAGYNGVAVAYIDDVTFEEVDAAADYAENLITNGTFEGYIGSSGSVSNIPYSFVNTTTYATVTDDYDKDYVHGGQYALRVEQTTPGGSVIFEKDGLVPGGVYTFGAWVRFDKSVIADERIYINNQLGQGLTLTEFIKGTTGWVYLSQKFVVPQDKTKMQFQIKADTGNGSSGKKFVYYIDDVSLVKTNEICDIAGARLYKETDGKWTTADYSDLSAGKRKFEVTGITNTLKADANIAAFIAVYNKDGSIASVGADKAAVNAGTTAADAVSLSAEVTVPETAGEIKTFIWDGDTLTPYVKPVKLLIIGNSITQHGVAVDKGWLYDWGMAATAREKDYAHILTAMAQEVAPGLRMELKNISEFETYFYDFSKFNISKYDDLAAFDADIIICTIGANIKNLVPEEETGEVTDITFNKEYYKNIIDHFNPNGNAKVIVGTTIFTAEGGEIQTAIKEAADTYGYPYVKMNDLTAEEYTAKPYAKFFPENISSGVLNHPGDKGMAEMAKRLWPELKSALAAFGIGE